MEHTVANLDTAVENTAASESRIRDTDIAQEMVTYGVNNVLIQGSRYLHRQIKASKAYCIFCNK